LRKVVLPVRGAEILFDVRDENVQLLESLFDVRISARGSELYVQGEEQGVLAIERILDDFAKLVSRGQQFSNGELKQAFQQIAEGAAQSLHDIFPKRAILATSIREVAPRSPNQARYVSAIEQEDLVFGIGPAGTGKTYLAVAVAVALLLKKSVQRIVLARPAVEAGEKLGFLPGDMQEKVNPYLRPLYDALFHMLEDQKVEKLLERGVIEIAPLAFMRGRTLSDAFIILDEAQNCTAEQMKMFLTRMGINSKAVVTGDITQIDLPRGQRSGLIEAREILAGVPGIAFCYFDERDVVRHRLVKLIIQAYEKRTAKLEEA
jgi:phosphate starvation-inducible protein PhoH and related proteins